MTRILPGALLDPQASNASGTYVSAPHDPGRRESAHIDTKTLLRFFVSAKQETRQPRVSPLQFGREQPEWFKEAFDTISALSELEAGWAGPGSLPPSTTSIHMCRRAVQALSEAGWRGAAPKITGSPDGEIALYLFDDPLAPSRYARIGCVDVDAFNLTFSDRERGMVSSMRLDRAPKSLFHAFGRIRRYLG